MHHAKVQVVQAPRGAPVPEPLRVLPWPRLHVGSCVPPLAAEARFDTRRRNFAWGEKQPSKRRTEQYSSAVSICLSDAGHRTFRCGVELFDVTSNFSTSHRTFRRDVEMFDAGHRKVGGERLPPRSSRSPPFPVQRADVLHCPPQVSPQNPLKMGFTFFLGTRNLRRG